MKTRKIHTVKAWGRATLDEVLTEFLNSEEIITQKIITIVPVGDNSHLGFASSAWVITEGD